MSGARSARRAQGQSLRPGARQRLTTRPSRNARRCRRSSRRSKRLATIARGANAIAAFNAKSPFLKRGIALTPVKFGISFTLIHLNQAGALVHVYSDGSIHLNHGGTEMGQGLFTKVAQVVAEEFGVPLRLRAHHRDQHRQSAERLADGGVLGNRHQRHGGEDRRRRDQGAHGGLRRGAWGVAPETIEFRDGRVFGGNNSMSFGELAKACRLTRVQLSAAGYYSTPEIPGTGRSDRQAVLLFRLWRRVLRGRHRHADRRDEGAARRHPARRRLLAQSGDRHRSGRGRLHPGHGLADHRGTGVRRQGPADDPRAGDLQDPRRLRRARRSSTRGCICGRIRRRASIARRRSASRR